MVHSAQPHNTLIISQREPGSKLGEGQGIGQLPIIRQHDYQAENSGEGSPNRPPSPPNMPEPGMTAIQAGTETETLGHSARIYCALTMGSALSSAL